MPQVAEPQRKIKKKTRERTRLAPQHKVLVHDDDLTPREFVVVVLERFFELSHSDATRVMLEADRSGVALVCVLPLEVAERCVDQAHSHARAWKYPLTFTIEGA